MTKLRRTQGYFYIITGAWPIIHLSSFIQVTGQASDIWLVHLVGLLAISVGISLTIRPHIFLSIAVALSFLVIDLHHVMRDTIPKIYLVDACIQLLFIGWWILVQHRRIMKIIYFRFPSWMKSDI